MRGIYILINNRKKILRGWVFSKTSLCACIQEVEVLSGSDSEFSSCMLLFEGQNCHNYRMI